MLINGLYDQEPIVASSLNTLLCFDAAGARGCSPGFHIINTGPLVCFAGGTCELSEMRRQTEAYHNAWRRRGHPGWLKTIEGADHFTRMEYLVQPKDKLVGALLWLSNTSGAE